MKTHATICLRPCEGKAEIVLIGGLKECAENARACQRSSGLSMAHVHYMVVAVEETGEIRFYDKTSHTALAETLLAALRSTLSPVSPRVDESSLVVVPSHLTAEQKKGFRAAGLRTN